jgi:hypothetical protein
MAKKIKLSRYAREIKVRGQFRGEPDEIKTRMSKGTYEKKAELFDDPDFGMSAELGGYEYRDFVEWGGQNTGAGRPSIYDNPAIRQKAYRIRKKLKQGKPMNNKDIEWLRSKGINYPSNNKLANK